MPLLRQLNGLLSKPELRGLTHDLRPAIPDLTKLTRRSIPFLHTSRALASCTNQVLVPFFQSTVPDPDGDAQNNGLTNSKVYPQMAYASEGLGGISRAGDANGQPSRVLGSSGPQILSFPSSETGQNFFTTLPFPVQGVRPAITSSLKTPFRPNVPCEQQQPPNLDSGEAGAPPPQKTVSGSPSPQAAALQKASMASLAALGLGSRAASKQSAEKGGSAAPTGKAAALVDAGEQVWNEARKAFLAGKVAKVPDLKTLLGGGGG
jgi:hypothetical protein